MFGLVIEMDNLEVVLFDNCSNGICLGISPRNTKFDADYMQLELFFERTSSFQSAYIQLF